MKIVVFGGHSPIAIAISKKLAASRVNTIHVSRNPQTIMQNSFSKSDVQFISIDLENEIEANKIWTKLIDSTKIDGVVFAQRYRGNLNNFNEMLQCDVITPFRLIEELCAKQNADNKRILLFTSPASDLIIPSQGFPYHATKTVILSMMKYFASGRVGNVTANAICPSSYVYKERARAFYEKNKSYYSGIESCIPSKNFTQVEEIATLVNFLMIKASTSINGQQFMLDGGLSVLDHSHLIDKFIPLDDKF